MRHELELQRWRKRRRRGCQDGMFLEGIGGEKDVKTATELFMRADAGGSLDVSVV